MIQDFIFSVNSTFPVFLVMLAGYFFRRWKMFDEHTVNVINKFNFNVTLPLLLYKDLSTANIREVFDLKYVLFCMIVTSICFFSIWGFSKKFVREKESVGAFVQASFRGSAAVLGIAFIQNMYGNSGMAPLMIVGAVPLYNIYAIIVLSFESGNAKGKSMKSTFLNIIKNPIILGIFAGIVASLLNIKLPVILDKTVSNFSVMATPLALVAIGAGFEGKKAIAKIKLTVWASLIKLIIQPLIFLPLAVLCGFTDQKLIALLIMLGSPTTASCYIMAKNMDNDAVLTSSAVVCTTLFASVSLTLWVFLLRSFELI
jgi:predicted permease